MHSKEKYKVNIIALVKDVSLLHIVYVMETSDVILSTQHLHFYFSSRE